LSSATSTNSVSQLWCWWTLEAQCGCGKAGGPIRRAAKIQSAPAPSGGRPSAERQSTTRVVGLAAAYAVMRVRPDDVLWIVIGDLAVVERGIRELGFGEIVRLDGDGRATAAQAR